MRCSAFVSWGSPVARGSRLEDVVEVVGVGWGDAETLMDVGIGVLLARSRSARSCAIVGSSGGLDERR